MNKKRYMAPQMKITKLEYQGFITAGSQTQSFDRGTVETNEAGEYVNSEDSKNSGNPFVYSNGSVFGD